MIVEVLFSQMAVGPEGGKPNSVNIDLRYLAILAHDIVARNLVSGELRATTVCLLEWYIIAPP